MNSYRKNPPPLKTVPKAPAAPAQQKESEEGEQKIAINGFQQILDMLRVADPEFRESLLRRLAARDRTLAQALRRDLA
jgi:hypothetical protein